MDKYFWRSISRYCFDIKLDNEGNIIVAGKIVKTATFSDGEELGDPNAEANKYYTVVLKLDGNTGEIIWKSLNWILGP